MSRLAAVWLILEREIVERMRTRSFAIITALIMLMTAGSVAAVEYLPGVFETPHKHVGLAVTGEVDAIEKGLSQSAEALGVDIELRRFADQAAGEEALRKGEIDALFVGHDQLLFESKEDQAISAVVSRALYLQRLPEMLSNLGMTLEDVRPLIEPPAATVRLLDPEGEKKAADKGDRTLVAQAATMIMFLALVFYGQSLLSGVLEEKSSRVVEVLLGTVTAEQLLTGKVLGILASALCQLAAGFGAAGVALVLTGGARMPGIALDVALISCVFFFLGILSYGFLYATAGATISRESQSESAQMPLSLALTVPYFLSLTVLTDSPDGVLARVLSLLPPTTPMAMPARVALGEPMAIEIVASIALMVPWLLAVIWFAARVYSASILRGGPRFGLAAAVRSAFAAHGT